MFIGHYGVAFTLKKWDTSLSMGLYFLATMLLDIILPILLLLGVESLEINPEANATVPLEFTFYPFSHGLLATFIWALIFSLSFYFLSKQELEKKRKLAFILGIAVLSHWLLDFIVHIQDLPIFDGTIIKVGLGLWNFEILSYIVESVIFIAGLIIYLKATDTPEESGLIAGYGMIIFGGLLLLFNSINLIGPPPPSVQAYAIVSLTYQILFIAIVFWLDKNRISAKEFQ